MKRRMSVPIFGVLILLLTIGIVTAQNDDCPELVKRALTAVAKVCDTLGRNEACYGNDRLQAELDQAIPFAKPADRVSVGDIRSIRTFGLDEKAGTWGIALLNVQANLPDTLPGQAVKFILYGDVALQNASGSGTPTLGPMQAFYFTTSAAKPNCKQAPASSLVIQSPKGYRVNLTANGMDLNVGSSVALTAQRGGRMTVTTMEGKVYAGYNGKQQMIPQGFETSVQLGGDDGFTPQDAPDTAYLMDDTEWQPLADATDGLMEDPITLPDTSQWKAPDDYCADPANADVCGDPAFKEDLSFAACPPDVCPPADDVVPPPDPNATPCPDVFCDALPPPDSCSDCSTPVDQTANELPAQDLSPTEQPVDNPPAPDQAPTDQPAQEQPSAEQPPADNPPPAEQPPADNPPPDQPPADNPPPGG